MLVILIDILLGTLIIGAIILFIFVIVIAIKQTLNSDF